MSKKGIENDNDGAHIVGPPASMDIEGVLRTLAREDRKQLGMRPWLYRLRFIVAGVRILRRHGWPLAVAWSSVAADFDSDGLERHFGYTPEHSAAEALSYWD